jgi:hypothetical protein
VDFAASDGRVGACLDLDSRLGIAEDV